MHKKFKESFHKPKNHSEASVADHRVLSNDSKNVTDIYKEAGINCLIVGSVDHTAGKTDQILAKMTKILQQ